MNVQRVNMEDGSCIEQFCDSLKNTGFAVIYNHAISPQLISEIYQEWIAFFSHEQKNNYAFNPQTQDGFFSSLTSETAKGHTEKDIKEYFQYYPWGQYPTELSNKTQQLYDKLNALATTLLNWVEAGLPSAISAQLSLPLSQMVENTQKTMLRILHYPPFIGNEPIGAVRAAAHGDINLLTLLVGATDNGLQVQNQQGQWFDVPTDQESIAVNIGDMLEMCTQGYYRSTLHRVINPGGGENKSRLSMPLFLHPRPEVRLSQAHTAGSFLNERLNELGVI